MSEMSHANRVLPLKYNGNIISYPYKNPNPTELGVPSLLVDVTNPVQNTVVTYSLKHTMLLFDNKYAQYLQHNKENELFDLINQYFNTIIETQLNFKYGIGQWGWLTYESDLTKSLCKITELTEFATERYYLHDKMQKYNIEIYDITSSIPLKWTNEMLGGNAEGWIKEGDFDYINRTNATLGASLNWMICREAYLLRNCDEQKAALQNIVANRGIVFRDTADQFLKNDLWQPMRGKIKNRNRGSIQEVDFKPPNNFWTYLFEPKLKEIKNMQDDFTNDAGKNIIELNIFDLHEFGIEMDYLVKFYDQFNKPFRINSCIMDSEQLQECETLEPAIKIMIQKLNTLYQQKYEKVIANNQRSVLRTVSYFVSVNACKWIRTISSGRTTVKFNVYKCTILANRFLYQGVINNY